MGLPEPIYKSYAIGYCPLTGAKITYDGDDARGGYGYGCTWRNLSDYDFDLDDWWRHGCPVLRALEEEYPDFVKLLEEKTGYDCPILAMLGLGLAYSNGWEYVPSIKEINSFIHIIAALFHTRTKAPSDIRDIAGFTRPRDRLFE